MSTLYEIVELANGDIALQKEGEAKKNTDRAPLLTMRFSTDLLRFLRGAKMDIAKVMIEAGLERVAMLAESVIGEQPQTKMTKQTTTDKPAINSTTFDVDESNANQSDTNRSGTNNTDTITQNFSDHSGRPNHSNATFGGRVPRNNQARSLFAAVDPDDQHPTVSHLLH